MDRRERAGRAQAALLALMAGVQSTLQTAMPGIIQSFDASKRTVVIQPALQARVQNPDGSYQWVNLPLLLDCPVVFPSGGGVTLTFPIMAGDECLVIFASRCIDAWWQAGGHANIQADLRMHDLSDGFALVGVSSIPKVVGSISTTKAQLRTDDGLTYVEVDPAGHVNVVTENNASVTAGGTLTATAGGAASVTAPTIALVGAVSITGTLAVSGAITGASTVTATGEVTGNGKALSTHVHGGVTAGGANTGVPI